MSDADLWDCVECGSLCYYRETGLCGTCTEKAAKPRKATKMKRWTDEECRPFDTPWRPAEIISWYDADTPTLRIDVGFDIDGVKTKVRLQAEGVITTPDDKSDDSVDAWEVRGKERTEGLAAKSFAVNLIPPGSTVRIWSRKAKGEKGKYGRWLAVILYSVMEPTDEPNLYEKVWYSLGDALVRDGHAEYVTY